MFRHCGYYNSVYKMRLVLWEGGSWGITILDKWKSSIVCQMQMHKSGLTSNVENCTVNYSTNVNEQIVSGQHRFRSGISTATNLPVVWEEIKNAFTQKFQADDTYKDLQILFTGIYNYTFLRKWFAFEWIIVDNIEGLDQHIKRVL